MGAVIDSVTFDGKFHADGNTFVLWAIPLGAGPIDSKLNGDPSFVNLATAVEDKLYNSKINCEDALGWITAFSTIN